jgi:tRNA-splicing endonuclease subunit Sen54
MVRRHVDGAHAASLFAHLRVTLQSPPRPRPDTNPYMPFFHVWKPATAWSKAKWDRGSDEGLARQRPDYAVAAVE